MTRKNKTNLPVRKTEPAMIRAAVVAILGLLASLGFTWAGEVDKETLERIVIIGVVVVPLLQGLWTRFGVVAKSKVLARLSTSTGAVVAGEAATTRTDTPLPADVTPAGSPKVEVILDPALIA